jgi:arsenate reductase|tara:strand:- start:660 stop:1046 length:387 start_codon:yes stop_codon:yes gene_type:complete
MAEGFARSILSNEISIIDSAGVKAEGVNPIAVKVMSEIGIDISRQESTEISSVDFNQFDLVVTVCDNAQRTCPIILNKKIIHKNIYDPALAKGNINNQLEIYRSVRNQIECFVKEILKNYLSLCQEIN